MILGGHVQLFALSFHILFSAQSEAKGFYRMTSILGYRNDGRCGPNHRLRHGAPSHCSVYGASPCCNYKEESCGAGENYCECDGCTDFRTFNLAERDVSTHLRKKERVYIISLLTTHLNINNWATIDHIQYSKKINKTRINYVLIIRESHCAKTQPLNLEHCQLKSKAINRIACFITLDYSTGKMRIVNRDCIRAKVYERKPRAKIEPQMNKTYDLSLIEYVLIKLTQIDGKHNWYTHIGAPKITPHNDYKEVAHIELKIKSSMCQRNRSFIFGCSGIRNGEVKSCSVDVRVSVEKYYRLIHYNCDAICGSRSSSNFEDREWTHWSKGLCHQGVRSRIRFCYDHLSRETAFDCEGTDIKLTQC